MKKEFVFIVIISIISIMISCAKTEQELLPGIESFFNQHPDYGTVLNTKDLPDWANGKRQQVTTSKGTYLFYTHNNEVVGVWLETEDGKREKIFSKEIPGLQKDIKKEAVDDLPAYTIIDQAKLISGGKSGDILITSFSKATPAKVRESVLRRIVRKEGFTEAYLYCTMEAYKANYSSSYLKAHPNALKEGYLGSLRGGKFRI